MDYTYKQLSLSDIVFFKDLMKLFGEVFKDEEAYQKEKPTDGYIKEFLSDSSHIVLVALARDDVVGGLVAYELKKFEQERSEIYIYDLAVSSDYQRKGVATSLIESLKRIAKERGAYTIFVQADKEDSGAIDFYKSLDVIQIDAVNFDIKL